MVKIEDLTIVFGEFEAVKHETIEIKDGEILGMVGESGSGKSVSALTLMGLLSSEGRVKSGKITFDGTVLLDVNNAAEADVFKAGMRREKSGILGKRVADKDDKQVRTFQGSRMTMIFQEPMTSLNPTQRIGKQVAEVLKLHAGAEFSTKEAQKKKVLETFVSVGLHDAEKVYESYPHELSGGMRQRVMIAMALILHPSLIIADEPTTALDVTIQNQIIALLKEINEREKISMLFITHDLNLARRICRRIVVMKDGSIVEEGETEKLFLAPRNAYTQTLIEAVPTRMKKAGRTADIKNAAVRDADIDIIKPGIVSENQRIGKNVLKEADVILEVKNVNIYYRDDGNSLFRSGKKRQVVYNADFAVKKGEVLGLVGESGCGKTSLSKAILGMNPMIEGEIRHYSKYPQMIFQDPYSSLNPAKTIGWLLQEPLLAYGELVPEKKMTKADRVAAAYDMLKTVGIEESFFGRKPSQLSGGQRQRISIGQALITRPSLVIADEPVSALDVTLQAQIMELMLKLKEEMELSYIFISHDINVIYQMSDRIMVMKDGSIVEMGDTEEVFAHPQKDYTKILLAES